MASPARRVGTIALVGRPNVGKSTLLNAILGERLAITSHHPQTTRDRIAGILTTPKAQYVFQDTPGLHAAKTRLGHRMNHVAEGTAVECDAVVFVTDALSSELRPEDRAALAAVPAEKKVILVVNKIDKVAEKTKLFDVLAAQSGLRAFEAIVPLSAKKRDGIDRLLDVLADLLPKGDLLYPDDELSDRPVRFFVAELVREQILLRTRQEIPHGVAVTVDAFEEPTNPKKPLTRIKLTVHVAKDSHKGILIGQGGQMLAAVGTAARRRVESLLGHQVHLDVKVRATPGWFDDAAQLADLGYADEGGRARARKKTKAGAKKKAPAAAKKKVKTRE